MVLKYKVRQAETFVILGNFLPFQSPDNPKNNKRYYHFTYLHHKWQSWCTVPEIWSATDRIFCHSGMLFVLLTSYGLRKPKFWKNKKTPGDIIILHKSTINDNHIMYASCDMNCHWQFFLSFWTVFCPFTPLTTQKIKILKTWNHHFTQVHQK